MNKNSYLLAGSLVACALAFRAWAQRTPEEQPPHAALPKPKRLPTPVPQWARTYPDIRAFLGDPTISILSGATRTETFRISELHDAKAKHAIGGFPIIAVGKTQRQAFTHRLSGVLLNYHTYAFGVGKNCAFIPGVAFRVWKGREFAEVVLCFNCNEVSIHTHVRGHSVHWADADFDPAREKLVRLAKQAFPRDKEIRQMRAKE